MIKDQAFVALRKWLAKQNFTRDIEVLEANHLGGLDNLYWRFRLIDEKQEVLGPIRVYASGKIVDESNWFG